MNVLSPGQIDTPDSQRLDKETRQMFESLIPRGKMGRPEEIASAALFLASDEASYVNRVETEFVRVRLHIRGRGGRNCDEDRGVPNSVCRPFWHSV